MPLLSGGLIFTRYVYVRYADGLIIEGRRILNFIVICFVSFYAVIIIIFLGRFSSYFSILDIHKGRVCTLLPLNFSDPETQRQHQKPKIITCSIGMYVLNCFSASHVNDYSLTRQAHCLQMSKFEIKKHKYVD